MRLATAELLDGARDQWERLVSTAGEDVGGAEGRGDDRYHGDELPLSADVQALLEDPNRTQGVPATEAGAAELEQHEGQREGMIGRLSDLHGGLGVAHGLVESAELGKHVGEPAT